MTELVYHDGHYHHHAPVQHPEHRHPEHRHDGANRHEHHQRGLWQKTFELWDHVLYGVGSVYYKIRGR
ncbi:hypothetical protein ACJ41O_003163 [Fusarium nematophilum]